jgi:uncharacterized alpha-E superfamily protein
MLSRVADNLYWMSRYLERAEHTARVIDVTLDRVLDQLQTETQPYWDRLLTALKMIKPYISPDSRENLEYMRYVAFDTGNPNSILTCVASARENARQVREQISSEMWEHINSLYLKVKQSSTESAWQEEPHKFLLAVREGSHLVQGITDGTMHHNQGWHFIQVGRFLERSLALATLLEVHQGLLLAEKNEEDNSDYLEWVALLKSCTAFEAYCKVYTAELEAETIAEFLILNRQFPHALCFAVSSMQIALEDIAELVKSRKTGRINRLAGRLQALLDYGQIDEILSGGLVNVLRDVQDQCSQLHLAIHQTYIDYPIDREISA